jgi:hypothetical protein
MTNNIIQYRVKPGRGDENEAMIRRVFEELHLVAPEGLRYASFKQDDGLSFVHLVSVDGDGAATALRSLEAFKAFSSSVKDRCEEQPVNRSLLTIGSYRLV